MKNFQALVFPVVLSFLLSACATDNTPKPTPLSKTAPDLLEVKVQSLKASGNGNGGQALVLGATVQGNTLVSASENGEVSALDLQKNIILWKVNLGHILSATPGTNSDTVFVGTKDAQLYALDLATGKVRWSANLPSLNLGAPTATDAVVVVQTHDSSVTAFDSATGNKLWSYQATLPSLTLYANSSPSIANNTVYVGFDSGQLGAFDLYRGVESWQIPIAIQASTEAVENMVDIDGTPVLDNSFLFATAYHGTIAGLDIAQGKVLWQRAYSSYKAPVVAQGKVIAVDEKGTIQAFDENTGASLWQQKALRYRFVTAPAVINNTVVVGDYAGYVHFLSLSTGDILARVKVSGSAISAQPQVYGNEVIITADNGDIRALQPVS